MLLLEHLYKFLFASASVDWRQVSLAVKKGEWEEEAKTNYLLRRISGGRNIGFARGVVSHQHKMSAAIKTKNYFSVQDLHNADSCALR